ncbi:prolyl oligopeptidase family serine peptidase [Mucilaginibacter koreensis]
MKKILTLLLLTGAVTGTQAQTLGPLTVEKIMRDPKWMGTSPDRIRWSDDSKKIYFTWNSDKADQDALYSITTGNLRPQKMSMDERRQMSSPNGTWNRKHTAKLFESNGDIFLYDLKAGKTTQLTSTTDRESNAAFVADESGILFMRADNLYLLNMKSGLLTQLTNFSRSSVGAATPAFAAGRRGGAAAQGSVTMRQGNSTDPQAQWLKNQQTELFEVIRDKEKTDKEEAADRKALQPKRLKEIPIGEQSLSYVQLSPNQRYITYRLIKQAEGAKATIVPNYVTASGYTEDINNRTKVGAPQSTSQSFVFDRERDTVYAIATTDIPGIKDLPDYVKDYPKQLEERTRRNEDRRVTINGPYWSEDAKNAVVVINAQDNKDRWIMKLDANTGKLSLIDRQRDEAWIGGPGIGGGSYSGGTVGWLDNTHFYFQSEASGYSHIYVADVTSGTKKQLTSGNWEVQSLDLSNNKKTFYFTANKEHPGITEFYRMPVTGGTPVQITSMKGGNEVSLSPDERWLAIRYSYSNKPWELYLQPNKVGAKAMQVTNSITPEFKSYAWRDPEMVTFKNRFGNTVYARVYPAKNPAATRPAVVFVHGAGYLQNVHYWWSSYFHEYMFNNMLADNGYTVIDIDYTGSSGYGRNWRTGIYRHMGGKDLDDQVDGVKYLVEKYNIDPKHVGMYGGSYGGFMTLMALFTQPDVFASGAALRSVTDWAHYNHGYTDNILNEPYNDEKAYRQSSPIYFANGLKGNLLMCHGMVDQNVNFQDIVRLTQKLIELHKDNWSLAPYPVEDHGFTTPSSWADEYKRIYHLFETTLK